MSKSLIRELGEWNRLEGMFRENFSENALGDRDFRKMKLREYDRIWHAYNGKVQTTDERALITMLRFQRKKIRRALYPGLLRRLLNQMAGSLLRSPGMVKPATYPPSRVQVQDYGSPTLPAEAGPATKEKQVPQQSVRVQSAADYRRQLKRPKKQRTRKRGLKI